MSGRRHSRISSRYADPVHEANAPQSIQQYPPPYRQDQQPNAAPFIQVDPAAAALPEQPTQVYYQRVDGSTAPVPPRPESPLSAVEDGLGTYGAVGGFPKGGRPPSPHAGTIETEEEKRQSLVVRILRVIFIILQCIVLLVGLALLIAGSVWYRAVQKQRLTSTPLGTIALFTIGAGVAVFLLGCLGAMSALTRSRAGAVVYGIILLVLIGCQIYVLARTTLIKERVVLEASRSWQKLQPQERHMLQRWKKCCGFGGPEDRAAEPCQYERGCARPFRRLIDSYTGALQRALGVAIAIETLLVVSSIVISFLFKRQADKPAAP